MAILSIAIFPAEGGSPVEIVFIPAITLLKRDDNQLRENNFNYNNALFGRFFSPHASGCRI
jgi:hypothetical protein